MTVTTIDLTTRPGDQPYPLLTKVYLKSSWRDPWVENTEVAVDRVMWSVSPRVGVAQLYWRYGVGKLANSATFQQLARKDIDRWYVKIEIYTYSVANPSAFVPPKVWWGVVDLTRDLLDGSDLGVASGQQAFIAYSLERLLYQYPIRTARVVDAAGELHRIGNGLTCNLRGQGNRTGTTPSTGYHMFRDDGADGELWTTRDIVKYVIGECEPRNSLDAWPSQHFEFVTIDVSLDDEEYLPDWDAPEVELHGRSPGQVLNMLIARQRLLGWRMEVTGTPPNEVMSIVPFTFATEELEIDDTYRLLANPSLYHINLTQSAESTIAVTYDGAGTYDQVIVEGARRRSCFTISYDDLTLVEGWTIAQDTAYSLGASADAGYPPAAEVDKRRARNAAVRNSDALRDVYRRYKLHTPWDFKAGDGEGGAQNPVFLEDTHVDMPDDWQAAYRPYESTLSLLPTLPLKGNVDYSVYVLGGTIIDGRLRLEERTPIVVMQLPDDSGKWMHIEKIGLQGDLPTTNTSDNKRWSASTRVNTREQDPAIYINVTGQPQHVIASTDFVPLSEDRDLGSYDWRNMAATVAVEEDRRVFGAWPDSRDLRLPELDAVRILRIQAGDAYRLDYMPVNTILGVDEESGALVKSNIPQWINDARDKLRNVAKLAYQWYGQQRRTVQLSTRRIFADIHVGDVVLSVERTAAEDIDVATVVSQITIEIPLTKGEQPSPPLMTLVTAYAELDPLRV